ncbi:Cacna1c [Symbiodinium natans]|uniref:Cacna1c protein n=1 Tax=Symbiodinium natans TaxID=878477 RepID=A0A812GIE2_9DINO|nr:Cacna1c [Symbiodinium natans]
MQEITETAFFDIMIAVLVLADTACLIIQQEWQSEDGTLDDAQLWLRGTSAAIITTFGVEFLARCIAQIGRGYSWMLVIDGIVVIGSFVEVFWTAFAPSSSPDLLWIRPLRGLRLLRAIRNAVSSCLRRSSAASIALAGLARCAKPMLLALVLTSIVFMLSSVIVTLQVPGLLDEIETDEVKIKVLDKFGTVFDATATLMGAIAGSNDLGYLCIELFAESGHERLQIALFLGTVLFFVLLMGLSLAGIICGVLATQLIIIKGDAEIDGGSVSFRRNKLIVGSLDKAFRAAGHGPADNIDWNDIRSTLAVPLDDTAVADTEKVKEELNELLVAKPGEGAAGGPEHDDATKELSLDAWQERVEQMGEEELDDSEIEELSKYRCSLHDKGVTMEVLKSAYHEMALFGPVCVEDFILSVFKHASNVKTLPILAFNHQQNKVYSRLLLNGQVVDDGLREVQTRIGALQALLPDMIQEAEATSKDLSELVALEDRLEKKKEALRALIAEKEQEQGPTQIPTEELVQAQHDGVALDEMLKDLEQQVAQMEGHGASCATAAPEASEDVAAVVNSLADEMVEHVWQLLLQELQHAERGVAGKTSHL